jgi:hypothetical protein
MKMAEGKARVLVDHGEHKVDDLIAGAAAEHAVAHGLADNHPSAVKYAEKLARQKKRAAGGDDDE